MEKQHCYIDNHDGVITLVPVGRQCMVDGFTVAMPTRLAQGETGVEKQNCYLDNHDGVITFVPVARQGMVDGVTVAMPTGLPQGKTVLEKQNCYLDNHDGVITFVLVARQCMVDGVTVAMPTSQSDQKEMHMIAYYISLVLTASSIWKSFLKKAQESANCKDHVQFLHPAQGHIYEPRYEKTGFLHMRKQRHRSASR